GHPGPAYPLLDVEIVEHPDGLHPNRREARVQLHEADAAGRRALIQGKQDHRLGVAHPVAEELTGPSHIGWLSVELAVEVEQAGHLFEVLQPSTHDVYVQRWSSSPSRAGGSGSGKRKGMAHEQS